MNRVKALIRAIEWRAAAPSIILVINSFVWYILTYVLFTSMVNPSMQLGLFAIYNLGIAFSAILGAKFLPKKRSLYLKMWILVGALSTSLLLGLSNDNMLLNTSIVLFFGASIGVGLPSCLSYFADSTSIEKRGFLGGIIWSAVGFTVLTFAYLTVLAFQLEPFHLTLLLTIWRLSGGILFLLMDKTNLSVVPQDSPSYFELIRRREVLLFFLPWVLFSIINFAEVPIIEKYFNVPFVNVQLIEMAFVGIFAILGGFAADIVGRKRVVITGFVMLGVEYALMSVFASSEFLLYLFIAFDGITWGLLFSVFLTVIWGDLGENYAKEKFYVLGGLPFLLANFLPILLDPFVRGTEIIAFSFASFFLFLAVLPLMYASETLPEKKIREREIQFYVAKAQAIKQKYS